MSIHDLALPPTTYFSRKLKNRVAAQTARDRKKAKMGELEQQVLELELEVMKYSSDLMQHPFSFAHPINVWCVAQFQNVVSCEILDNKYSSSLPV